MPGKHSNDLPEVTSLAEAKQIIAELFARQADLERQIAALTTHRTRHHDWDRSDKWVTPSNESLS